MAKILDLYSLFIAAFETELQAQKERSRNAAAVDTDDWVELFPMVRER